MMTERPILFSGPMVRALLDGSKTQTRRAVRGNPAEMVRIMRKVEALDGYDEPTGEFGFCPHPRVISKHVRCPYGQAGDSLWVRETWHPYGDDGSESLALATSTCTGPEHVLFRASANEAEVAIHRWRPAIHMPRWASRIILAVTEVRIQRLQDVSEEDAKAEGITTSVGGFWTGAEGQAGTTPCAAYAVLWNSINGPGSWDVNPWVWAISFSVEGQP